MDISISKDKSKIIKGIAIIFVIFGHLNIIKNSGAWGVGLFLIVSGYGVTKSFYENGLKSFFKKKILNILIPYQIVTICLIIMDSVQGISYDLDQIITSILGINLKAVVDSTMWYIPYIIIWYIAFYLIFKYIDKEYCRTICLFIFSIILLPLCISNLWIRAAGSFLYVFQFPIGVIWAMVERNRIIKNEKKARRFMFGILGICVVFLCVTYGKISNTVMYLININSVCFGLLCILVLFNDVKLELFNKIGNISFELYLFEAIFMWKYDFIFKAIDNRWIAIIVYISFIIVLSILYKRIIEKITTYISNSLYRKIEKSGKEKMC